MVMVWRISIWRFVCLLWFYGGLLGFDLDLDLELGLNFEQSSSSVTYAILF